MKLLYVTNSIPTSRSYGGAVRTNDLWKALQSIGQTDVICIDSDYKYKDYGINFSTEDKFSTITCPIPRKYHLPIARYHISKLIKSITKEKEYDIIIVRYHSLLYLIKDIFSEPIVLDADDIHKSIQLDKTRILTSICQLFLIPIRNFHAQLQLKRCAHAWYLKESDRVWLAGAPSSLLAPVFDVYRTTEQISLPSNPVILMVGKFSYEPNLKGASTFARLVLPKLREMVPDVQFKMVGNINSNDISSLKTIPGVEIAGFVDDLSLEYKRANIVVAPIFEGGGVQIKLLEALSFGKPLIASSFAASGFYPHLINEMHLLVAENVDQWVKFCLQLLSDPTLATALGENGRALVKSHYNFELFSNIVKTTIVTVVSEQRKHA